MKALLPLLLATAAFGAVPYRSIQGATGKYATTSIPNTAPWNSRTTIRYEFRLHDWTSTGRVLQWDAIYCQKAASTVSCTNFYESGSPTVAVTYPAGATDIIVRVQRTPTIWSIEAWRADGSEYADGAVAPTTAATFSLGSTSLAILHDGGGTSGLAAGLAWLRVYSTAVDRNSAMPTNAPGGDLLDYEFEGGGTDGSAQGLTATLTGSPTFPSSPVVPMVGEEITVGSGRAFTPSCAGTNADSYKWRQQGGPALSVTFSDSTAAAPTVTGLTGFGQVSLTCTAVINGVAGTSTVNVGVVATNDAGVVIPSDPVIGKLVGPMLRSGVSEWSWADQKRRLRADYWYTATSGYTNDFTGTEQENYYDSCLVHYQNYYRTGLTRFLGYGRACADKWYSQYWAADALAGTCSGGVMAPRNASFLGLVIRAYETGQSSGGTMWTCLTAHANYHLDNWIEQRTVALGYQSLHFGARETAYAYMHAVAVAVAHPDSSVRASYVSRVSAAITGHARALQCQTGTAFAACLENYTPKSGTISATNGSATITGSGTAFTSLVANDRLTFKDGGGNNRTVQVSTVTNDTSLTLTGNFGGSNTSDAAWAKTTLGESVLGNWRWDESTGGYGGKGELAWHSALLIEAMQRAWYAGINTSTAATIATEYEAYLRAQASHVYSSSTCTGASGNPLGRYPAYSLWFIEGDNMPGCSSDNDLHSNRQVDVEMVGPHGFAYFLSGTEAAKTRGDDLWSAVFGGPVGPGADGGYGLFLDNAQSKMHGQSFRNPSYLAHRLGSAAADTTPVARSLSLGFSLAGVTNAAKIRVTVTMPSGETASATCTSSPCSVSGIDTKQGSAALMRLEYLSSGDAVLASGDQQPVTI